MPIDLRKYDRKYVEILYGSKTLIGRLVGNVLYTDSGTIYRYDFSSGPPYELNEQNISAITDITKQTFESLKNSEKSWADSEREWADAERKWKNAGWTPQQHPNYKSIVDTLANTRKTLTNIRERIREIDEVGTS
jgi:hypothetical protein